jgi:hypothetical protein
MQNGAETEGRRLLCVLLIRDGQVSAHSREPRVLRYEAEHVLMRCVERNADILRKAACISTIGQRPSVSYRTL